MFLLLDFVCLSPTWYNQLIVLHWECRSRVFCELIFSRIDFEVICRLTVQCNSLIILIPGSMTVFHANAGWAEYILMNFQPNLDCARFNTNFTAANLSSLPSAISFLVYFCLVYQKLSNFYTLLPSNQSIYLDNISNCMSI